MRKLVFLTLGMCIVLGALHVLAQGTKKKTTTKTTTQTTEDKAARPKLDSAVVFLSPEFYSPWPVDKNDTLLKYECIDAQDELLNADTLYNMNSVKYIMLVKTYTDYTRTYVDKDGRPQPMPVVTPIYRYDRNGADKWAGKNVTSGELSYFREYRDQVVRADTTIDADPVTGTNRWTIRKYYKVEQVNPE